MSEIPLYVIKAMENTPDELKQTIIELLNYLYFLKLIDKELFDYYNPFLMITTYVFNSLNIFKELLTILSKREQINMNDYTKIKIFILEKGKNMNIDDLKLKENEKHFIDIYYKYKI